MKYRRRITALERVPASSLRPNPRNWRTHPEPQKDVLRGVLAEIGFADALVARRLEDGSLELIDGHLRAETVPDLEVPVLILDVTEEEANKLLATHDPLAEMAGVDKAKLKELFSQVETSNESIRLMLEQTAAAARVSLEDLSADPSQTKMKTCPECGHKFPLALGQKKEPQE
jgi:hypothetical protein